MELLKKSQKDTLAMQGRLIERDNYPELDLCPVVRVQAPEKGKTWLLYAVETNDHDVAMAIYDSGYGIPTVARIRISIFEKMQRDGILIEVDYYYQPRHPLKRYFMDCHITGSVEL